MGKILELFTAVEAGKYLPIGHSRPVYRTEFGILKKCKCDVEASREANALCLASRILRGRLPVPRLHERSQNYLLLEDVGASHPETDVQFRNAAEYLAQLHLTDLAICEEELLQSKHCHYWNGVLTNRLRQEGLFATKTPLNSNIVTRFQDLIERLVNLRPPALSDVVGHGDPQVSNFVTNHNDAVCAIDWHQFGFSNRWYEVAHFAYSISEPFRDSALMAYRTTVGVSVCDWTASLTYGEAVDAVIRAGSVVRCGNLTLTSDLDRFCVFVETLAGALSKI